MKITKELRKNSNGVYKLKKVNSKNKTDEVCPICLACNLEIKKNNLVCPVCDYKRDIFYMMKLLSNVGGLTKCQ